MSKLNGFGFTNQEWQILKEMGVTQEIAKAIRAGKNRDEVLKSLHSEYESLYTQLKNKGKNDYELLGKLQKIETIKNTWH